MADMAYSSAVPNAVEAGYPVVRWPSWGAIVAGVVVACSAQLLFASLGMALGLSVFDYNSINAANTANAINSDHTPRILVAGALWWLVTGTIAMFIGGIVVGRFATVRSDTDLGLHALTTWAATAALGALLVAGGGMASLSAVGGPAMSYAGWSNEWRGNLTGMTREMGTAGTTGSTGTDGNRTEVAPAATNGPVDPTTAENARKYARNTAWLGLGGLVLGIAATYGGARMVNAEPDRVRTRAPMSGPTV